MSAFAVTCVGFEIDTETYWRWDVALMTFVNTMTK